MLYLPTDKMHPNKFVDVNLPTKSQIFSRTGQRAVSPAGAFTGDEPALIGLSPTEQAERFVDACEHYESPKVDESKEDKK